MIPILGFDYIRLLARQYVVNGEKSNETYWVGDLNTFHYILSAGMALSPLLRGANAAHLRDV